MGCLTSVYMTELEDRGTKNGVQILWFPSLVLFLEGCSYFCLMLCTWWSKTQPKYTWIHGKVLHVEGCVITAYCRHSTWKKWKSQCLRWPLPGISYFLEETFSDLLFHKDAVLEDRPFLQWSVLDTRRNHQKAPEFIQLSYGMLQPQTRTHHMVGDG